MVLHHHDLHGHKNEDEWGNGTGNFKKYNPQGGSILSLRSSTLPSRKYNPCGVTSPAPFRAHTLAIDGATPRAVMLIPIYLFA